MVLAGLVFGAGSLVDVATSMDLTAVAGAVESFTQGGLGQGLGAWLAVGLDWSLLTRTMIVVFVLADAPGNAPIVLALTKGMEEGDRRRVVDRASLVATLVLVGFALTGQLILRYFHISIASLQVAGGLLLLLIALDMLNGTMEAPRSEEGHDVAITPLAIPLLAGPGTLSTVMLLVTEVPHAELSVVLGILVAMAVTWLVVRQAGWIEKWLGKSGAEIFVKLMGFVLAALAVEMGSTGIKTLFIPG